VLALKNSQGRTFVHKHLSQDSQLLTAGSSVKDFRLELLKERLGQPRLLALILPNAENLPEATRRALALATLRLASYLGDQEELWVTNLREEVRLYAKDPELRRHLAPIFQKKSGETPLESGEELNAVDSLFKTVSNHSGIKQIFWISPWENLPPLEKTNAWQEEAKAKKLYFSFLALGEANSKNKSLAKIAYHVEDSTQLAYQLLSAAALSLGDYRLIFEASPAKVEISLDGFNESGQSFSGESLNFRIAGLTAREIDWVELKESGQRLKKWSQASEVLEVDLSSLAWKDGLKNLKLEIHGLNGERFEKSFSFFYIAKQALKFIKPLDQDSLKNQVQVTLSPGRRPGLGTQWIELYLNGESVGQATTVPFVIPLKVKGLSPGTYQLQAVQNYSDGSTEAQSIEVHVNDKAPEVKILRPSQGEFLDNLAEIEASVKAELFEPIKRVEFFVNGRLLGESEQAPYRFLWSNENFPVGTYYIQTRAFLNDERSSTDAVQVQLGQAQISVQADQKSQGKLFPDSVEVLVDASASMRESFGKALKIDLVDSALLQIRSELPESVRWIVRSYGESSSSFQQQCDDSSLLKQNDLARGFFPQGTSNLAYALRQVPQDLNKSSGSKVALLFTDGWDACGEDPLKAIQAWARQSDKLRLYVLYLGDAQNTYASLLSRLAEFTG
ncbi:MAG: hypothetical protein KDK66_08960, partial [Deltaproteobacteria bacterium]|nr:hypothetical protein [Deltaproteobacteria bacterium]